MPTEQWLQKYESIKDLFTCTYDLDKQFTSTTVGSMRVHQLDIGLINCPTGKLIACDPMTELESAEPFMVSIKPGAYPLKICVVPSERYGNRYSCVKLEISPEKPVRYELAITGEEDLDDDFDEDDVLGFGVDTATACLADVQAQKAFSDYWAERTAADPDLDPYEFELTELMRQNAALHPEHQSTLGDWLNFQIPNSQTNLVLFSTGFGDGIYPTYFGYNADGQVCAVYISFFTIEEVFDLTFCSGDEI